VIPTSARYGEGLQELLAAVRDVATGETVCRPHRAGDRSPALKRAVHQLSGEIRRVYPDLSNAQWVALRLLDGDAKIAEAVDNGELGELQESTDSLEIENQSEATASDASDSSSHPLLSTARRLRWQVGKDFHLKLMESIYTEAARLADRCVTRSGERPRFDWDRTLDHLVTSRIFGFPLMLLMLTAVFWITIAGANVPSAMLATLLIDTFHPMLKSAAAAISLPWWLDGLLIDGMYLATAWVVAVMLPPMAIFFPLFTLLEDFGYLPRVAFNLDRMFKRVGAHGKQALTMSMGWGCNAAAIVSTRIIDSPRERLIAIITNNFALCNGRWPTQILIASIFIGGLAPAHFAGFLSALSVVAIAVLGIALTFATSWLLSRTVLRGEVSTFNLELPPYRPPRILQTIYTSVIDRTLIVLWRAVVFALPAGAVIWLSTNVTVGGTSLAEWVMRGLDPLGFLLGLSGLILFAYIIAIPANEIVIPTILMLTVLVLGTDGAGTGVMFELEEAATGDLLRAGGWTLLMAVNLMLFSLIHNPCSTTIYTIWKETRSAKWTTISALLPVALGLATCFVVTQVWRIVAAL
jgi:ferrous iron transport protein B